MIMPSMPDGDHAIHFPLFIQAPREITAQNKAVQNKKIIATLLWVLEGSDEPAYSTSIV